MLLARFWPRPLLLLVLVAAFECSVGVEAASIPPHLSGDEIGSAGVLTLRLLAMTEPDTFLDEARRRLQRGDYLKNPEAERELRRWMGVAALQAGDFASYRVALDALEQIAASQTDEIATAYHEWLQSSRLLERGQRKRGLALALRAVERVGPESPLWLQSLAAIELCDAYFSAGELQQAVERCEFAERLAQQTDVAYDVARVANLQGMLALNREQPAAAIDYFQRAAGLFRSHGLAELAALVEDNLARVYIDIGDPQQGLRYARAALDDELRQGRAIHTLTSRANVARAESALGNHAVAAREIQTSIDEALAMQQLPLMTDLYAAQSDIAERAGDTALALQAARAAAEALVTLQEDSGNDEVLTLEARLAERERQWQVESLQRDKAMADLQLRQQALQLQSDSMKLALAFSLSALLAVGSAVLWLFWRQQRRQAARMREQSLTDPLTGIANRRRFIATLEALLANPDVARRHALMLLDIDYFKRLNDEGGHPFGDDVLRRVSACLIALLESDEQLLARIGGEEFGLLVPAYDSSTAMRIAQAACDAVARLQIQHDGRVWPLTISVGVALGAEQRALELSQWMRSADAALYEAKHRGRNQVVCAVDVGASQSASSQNSSSP